MRFSASPNSDTGVETREGTEDVFHTLRRFLADELCMAAEAIEEDMSFIDMGLDSISGVTWVRKINTHYGLSITATKVYNYPTLREFFNYVIAQTVEAERLPPGQEAPPPIVSKRPKSKPQLPVASTGTGIVDRFYPTITSRRKNRRRAMKLKPAVRDPGKKAAKAQAIAVIGMAGRFPMAENLDAYWKNLAQGRNCVSEVPDTRWPMSRFYDPKPGVAGKSNSKWMGVLEEMDKFDPLFFNIAPMEAEVMDPQQRLFLQTCWQCIENAGYPPSAFSGRSCGVFAGCAPNSYRNLLAGDHMIGQGGLGNDSSILAGRISYLFNFRGPSLAIDTACSASLVAVANACDSLALGNCDVALSGGAWVIPGPEVHIQMSQTGALSPDGCCFVFDRRANGFVPGEGVGVVLLKRLDDAIKDKDRIDGVIRGWGMNQDGKTNGITAPNEDAQADLQKEVYRKFSIHPEEIQLIEAHGTGTSLGDPIEVEALKTSFRNFTKKEGYCALGSVKSNIGHLAPAAGIAGLLKALLALRHRKLPPTLHYKSLNEHIHLEGSPFYVNDKYRDWSVPEGVKRRAAVNSFGFSGTNAHAVVEEWSDEPGPSVPLDKFDQPCVIILSAKSEDRLKEMAQNLHNNLAQHQEPGTKNLHDVAYTLQVGREAMEERLGMVVDSMEELMANLKDFSEGQKQVKSLYRGQVKRLPDAKGPSTADEAAAKKIEDWLGEGCYEKIVEHWVKGQDVDWRKIHGDRCFRRVDLPAYPFARERYWVSEQPEDDGGVSPGATLPSEEAMTLMAFEEVWIEKALPEAASREIDTLVCFLSDREHQKVLVNAVKTSSPKTKVIFVERGPDGKKNVESIYGILTNNRSAYDEVFRRIREHEGEVDAVLYLWPLNDREYIQDCSPLIYLLQAMVSTKWNPKYLLFAGSVEHVLDRCYLESWIGFERSLRMILPQTEMAVAIEEDPEETGAWANKLWAELRMASMESVCHTRGKRHVRNIRPAALKADGNHPLRTGGTYLITGGCGGLGLLFAQHLARTYAAKLILIGRSVLTSEKQEHIQDLEARGGSAVYLQVDVSDAEAMKKKVKPLGPVHGVIHAAGVEGNRSLFEKNLEDVEQVLLPKIQGTLALDEALADEPLDFVCYFSSSSALLGDFGSCDYAVGNRFQMAYAHTRNRRWTEGKLRGRTLVINWPLWKNGNMGTGDDEQIRFYLKSSGQRFLESDEGIALFEQLLVQDKTQYLILVGESSRIHRFLGLNKVSPTPLPVNATPSRGRRPEMKGLSVEACVDLDLKELVSRFLKIALEKLNGETNLADFGFDSISLAEFARLLSKHYDIEITPSVFFGHSTLGKLTRYFVAEHGERIQAFYQSEATPPAPVLSRLKRAENVLAPNVPEPIAIIGMSGRFPGAESVDEFWTNLKEGRNCITEVPTERWDWRSCTPGDGYKWGGFIREVDRFDPLFFEISPREAIGMDPKQRLFLEEAWHTFEDAGYMGKRIQGGSCGVYVGVEESEYGLLAGPKGQINSNQNATLAARISYTLDLRGPNLALTTACSSGLVALHQACLALRQGDCEMALVGGVNVLVSSALYAGLSQANMLSPNGRCCVFDRQANGLVPGEAVAVVLLKPLSRAIADQDHVYGCIKASGVNYDGKTNGITAPNPVSQAALLRAIYDKYHINPEHIQYVMAHSVGSVLGDPVEIDAYRDAFKAYTEKKQYCFLGSVKPLIGHTFAASGIVNLIGILMAMRDRIIPGYPGHRVSNQYIDFNETPFVLNQENQAWETDGARTRLGAIGSAGVSGTNAHAVIEEYTSRYIGQPDRAVSSAPEILPLSAKNRKSLDRYVHSFIEFLESEPSLSLSSLAYSLQTGRKAMEKRVAFLVQSVSEFRTKLRTYAEGKESEGVYFDKQKTGQEFKTWDVESTRSLKSALEQWIETKNLEKLAKAWAQGAPIDWMCFYEKGTKPQRLSLPTYPFQRKRYWIDKRPSALDVESVHDRENGNRGRHSYTAVWDDRGSGSSALSTATTGCLAANSREVYREDALKIRKKIGSVFRETMYFDEEDELDEKKSFSEMGLNSINAITFIEKINTAFKLQLDSPVIFDYSTVEDLSAHVCEMLGSQVFKEAEWARGNVWGGEPSTLNAEISVNPHQGNVHKLGGKWFKEYPEIIPLSAEGNKKPCFWIHPLTGSVGSYIKIAKNLGVDQPFWGIQSRGFLTERRPLNDLKEMARYYLEIVETLDPDGPYQLAGYSMGGVIAYEMVKQIHLKGRKVSSLILLEPPFPEPDRSPTAWPDQARYREAMLLSANSFLHFSRDKDFDMASTNFGDMVFTKVNIEGVAEHEIPHALAVACKERGVNQPLELIQQKIKNMATVIGLNREALASYHVSLLPLPDEVNVHYFTIFPSPHSTPREDDKFTALFESNKDVLGKDLTHTEDHYQKWKHLLPGMQVCRTPAQDHFHLLANRESVETILNECRFIYQRDCFQEQEVRARLHHPPFSAFSEVSAANECSEPSGDMAVIGMSGRFPGARNIGEFWERLKNGDHTVTEIPKERWDVDLYFDPEPGKKGKIYSRHAGFIDEMDQFDPLFFNISPIEAETMDPQYRLFLEETWKALEDAGYMPSSLAGKKVGLFIGGGVGDYPGGGFQLPSTESGRIAYLFDWKGPCLCIETTCSSALVALHEACMHLQTGQVEMAVVGAVSLMTTPASYLGFSYVNALSPTGKCYPFDKRADGTIFSESISSIILKRITSAQSDHDHIYGVIKGSGLNYDGKTNGLTAPSGKAQTALEVETYKKLHINPERITMVEAHGTGTKLGDPVEANALIRAFRQFTWKESFCALGSVKSNIGHTGAAAGLVGVIKVLLALQHKKIPPTINYRELNPSIPLKGSPFYINTDLKEWRACEGLPRMAAVSSFGFSGTNAHVVIEEYLGDSPGVEVEGSKLTDKPYLIVLSAKDGDRLKEMAQNLVVYINSSPDTFNSLLHEVAYTLQVGREAMEERLGFVVESVEELLEKLKTFLIDEDGVENLYRGQVQRNKEALELFNADADMEKIVDIWIGKGKFYKLVELWVKGFRFDWNKLYGDTKPHRISLPGYPFARERYWTNGDRSSVVTKLSDGIKKLHPLLHENTSTLSAQRFSSTFTGEEFFLVDHVVRGEKILPGTAYLEMARAAVEKAVEIIGQIQTGGIGLKNVVWMQPIAVNGHVREVHIRLFPDTSRHSSSEKNDDVNSEDIRYEVYTKSLQEKEKITVHSQGLATFRSAEKKIPPLDLSALRNACNQAHLSSEQCYETFKAMGIDYGPSHQGIRAIYVGEHQVLARLSLPSSVTDTQDQCVLHPGMLDSALQTSIALALHNQDAKAGSQGVYLPFALQSLEIFGPCPSQPWTLLQTQKGHESQGKVLKLDLDILDEKGSVCIRMRGFSCRAFKEVTGPGMAPAGLPNGNVGTLMCRPVWSEKTPFEEERFSADSGHVVILCELDAFALNNLEAKTNGIRFLEWQTGSKDIKERFQTYAVRLLKEIRILFKAKPKEKALMQVVMTSQEDKLLFRGLSGLLRTGHLENPHLLAQLIEIEPGETEDGLLKKLRENGRSPEDAHIRYRNGLRLVSSWKELPVDHEGVTLPWRDRGVYLITGGAGELGLIFAREIAGQTGNATLILVGRSGLSREKRDAIKELESLGATVHYRRVDVADTNAVVDLMRSVQRDIGDLQGIVHGAGIIRDEFILKKTDAEFRDVLAPKVAGTVNLDRAAGMFYLDFFVLFSSGVGAMGNPGQADYATANAFLDAYADYRNGLVASKERKGQTLSVNWPLWEEGGMGVEEARETMMLENTGLIAMKTSAGIQAFYRAMVSGQSRVMVLEGDLQRFRSSLAAGESLGGRGPLEEDAETDALPGQGNEKTLKEKALNYFKELLSSALKLSPHRIQSEEPLEKYGIDSILVTQLTNELEKSFGSLSKTIFFEYQTLQEVTDYFLEAYGDKLRSILNIKKTAVHVGEAPRRTELEQERFHRNPHRARFTVMADASGASRPSTALDIAIIGLAGRYPQARNLQAFWENLRDGKDCITEVPKDRWDWRDYYAEDPEQARGHGSKWGGFIEDVDKFDPLFFNISRREAMFIDPQERLFLEQVWMALEDAGYCPETLRGKPGKYLSSQVGVYAGVMYGEYQLFGVEASMKGRRMGFAGNLASISNRVSYVLNLHGPSMTVDTMCSSSLTCIHLACQDLKLDRTDLGIAGGVNITIHPNKYLMLSGGQFISNRGHCESFGEGGDGYIPGEGVGVVLLKRLADAERDGDHIYGVIKGSAVNHGGKTNGYTVPNPNAQQMAIARALDQSRIDPRLISYIEAHGTGTKLGDPIEITGLTKAFSRNTNRKERNGTREQQYCWIGSAKSNIGHCESAAGIAGLTKVLLQMKYGKIVPSLHSNILNPNIDFPSTPFIVNQTLRDWCRPVIDGHTVPRIAGISSFGAGGSNAHIIIEEWSDTLNAFAEANRSGRPDQPCMILLSAKDEDRLKKMAQNLLAYLNSPSDILNSSLQEVAYTLQVGRQAMDERLGLLAVSHEELGDKLRLFLNGAEQVESLYRGKLNRNEHPRDFFTSDEDMAETIDAWMREGTYSKILERWVKGVPIDWDKLYDEDEKPRRISLPVYPFALERHWVPPLENETADVSRVGLIPQSPNRPESTFTPPFEKPKGLVLTRFPVPPKPVMSRPPETSGALEPLSQRQQTVSADPSPKSSKAPEPERPIRAVIARDVLQAELMASLTEVLFMKPNEVDIDKPFTEIGLDSIVGVEWMKVVNTKYALNIPSTKIYDYSNVRAFTSFLLEELERNGPEETAPSPVSAPAGSSPVVKAPTIDASQRKPVSVQPARQERIPVQKRTSGGKDDIAIIGLSGRYPQADTVDEFWRNLKEGRDCITEIPEDRWDHSLYYDKEKNTPGKTSSKWGGFIESVDQFDPLFFNISPREAEMIDPNERLFLETVWNLLEKVGYTRDAMKKKYQSKVGVFAGAMYQHYHAFGTAFSAIANRVSYFFDFEGPSLAVDTMCSSSAVAIHMARESLLNDECELAIAGGVNLSIRPEKYLGLSAAQMIGSHPGARSFSDGDGMLPSEGVGAVLLKPLSRAVGDRDTILAVIKSSAVNHGGHANGFSVPNPGAQARLIEHNFKKAGIDPRTISYVESAANGFALGDAIEISALSDAFRKFTSDQNFCAIGSVKSNIGHAEAASGISQLTKVVLQLQHKQLAPTIKADPLNPNLNFGGTSFYLQKKCEEWKRPVLEVDCKKQETPRRATVSSFGAGGSNAHFIIEEYRSEDSESGIEDSGPILIVLSAKNPDRLEKVAKNLCNFLKERESRLSNVDLHSLAYTLQVGREAMDHRFAMVAKTGEDVMQGLEAYLKSVWENRPMETFLPVFTGNLENDHAGVRSLLSGTVGETVVQVLLKENNLEKLALHWTQGGEIPWESLAEGADRSIMPLPTYPFDRKRYWIETPSRPEIMVTPNQPMDGKEKSDNQTAEIDVEGLVTGLVANLLKIKATELNSKKPLNDYGMDSVLGIQLFQQLKTQADPLIDPAKLQSCKTIQEIVAILPEKIINTKPAESVVSARVARSAPAHLTHFPELIHLNHVMRGRPVFWFHGALGEVQVYQELAAQSQRPFYGVQARGWMTDRAPLHGVQAMASYYVHIIQSVQPEGPYDLGGYSLGGLLAYEVARQLQELGQTISSIVMLDTIQITEKTADNLAEQNKNILFQIVNLALSSMGSENLESGSETYIHRDELDLNQEDEAFLSQLIFLAKKRGMKKTKAQLRTMFEQLVKIYHAYELQRFTILPLPDPRSINAYYFRNKSGLFFGELEPFYLVSQSDISFDHTNYWSEWEAKLPNLEMIDLDAPNHMALLSEPKAKETIFELCEALYSGEGISKKLINTFKRKTNEKHGRLSILRDKDGNA